MNNADGLALDVSSLLSRRIFSAVSTPSKRLKQKRIIFIRPGRSPCESLSEAASLVRTRVDFVVEKFLELKLMWSDSTDIGDWSP